MAKQTEIAAHIDLSARRVRDLLPKLGCKAEDGMDAIRLAYIRYLREVAAARQSKDGGLDLVGARTVLAKQQAEAVRLKNAFTRGELVYAKDVQTHLERLFAAIKAHLLRFPSKLTPRLVQKEAAEVGATLASEVRQVLTELATWDINEIKRGKQ